MGWHHRPHRGQTGEVTGNTVDVLQSVVALRDLLFHILTNLFPIHWQYLPGPCVLHGGTATTAVLLRTCLEVRWKKQQLRVFLEYLHFQASV